MDDEEDDDAIDELAGAEDEARDDEEEDTGIDGAGEETADEEDIAGAEDVEEDAGAEEVADEASLLVAADVVTVDDADEEPCEATTEEDAPPGFVGVTVSELELEFIGGGFEGAAPLALAPPPPPHAAVNSGAKNATAKVVLRRVYCQLSPFNNCWRVIKPSSISISPSSVLAVV